MTPTDQRALVERLRAVESSSSNGDWSGIRKVTTNWHRNPDGPEAADYIEALQAELASLLQIVDEIDTYQKRPESGDYGVECACCMGELFDNGERQIIEKARALAAEQRGGGLSPFSPSSGSKIPAVDDVQGEPPASGGGG